MRRFRACPTGRTALYRQRGEKFLRLFLHGQADPAFAMMHENLQKIVPMEKLKEMMAETAAKAGTVKTLDLQVGEVEPSGKLKIVYELDAEKASGPVSVKFEFRRHEGPPGGLRLHRQGDVIAPEAERLRPC